MLRADSDQIVPQKLPYIEIALGSDKIIH